MGEILGEEDLPWTDLTRWRGNGIPVITPKSFGKLLREAIDNLPPNLGYGIVDQKRLIQLVVGLGKSVEVRFAGRQNPV